jgi:hypothetical protein
MYLIGGSRPSRGFIVPGRPNEKGRPLQVRFLEGGSKVICGSNTGEVRMWDTSSGEVFQNLPHGGTFYMNFVLVHCLTWLNKTISSKAWRYVSQQTGLAIPESVLSLKCFQGDYSYIAAAPSQKGQNSHIQIWRAKTSGRFLLSRFLQLIGNDSPGTSLLANASPMVRMWRTFRVCILSFTRACILKLSN